MKLSLDSRLRLREGVEIPVLGLGTAMSTGAAAEKAVKLALECGYRHIDTARVYRNEKNVGKAVRESGVPREQIFVTTKLANSDQGYEPTLRACEGSLRRLGLTYVDLYLIHWPVHGKRVESWKAMVRLEKEGRCRSIGVSNYMERHMMELFESSPVRPSVNQVEFHPFLYQQELLGFCRENDVQLEAYSPLTRGRKLNNLTLRKLAEKYEKTSAQIMIRWGLQHGLVVIPKSVREERILENSQVFEFDISQGDVEVLNSLNQNLHTDWNPSNVA